MNNKFDIKKINLEVKNEKKISNYERKKLKDAKLINLGKLEVWTAIGTNNELSYSTHGIFRFFGKFPPPIAFIS